MKWHTVAPVILTLAFALPAYAQFDAVGGPDLTIVMNPAQPSAKQTVHLTAQSTFMDLTQSEISWYVNGSLVAHGLGVTDTTITAGGYGTATNVSVAATGAEGSASAQTSIRPAQLDLLWDAASYVPPLYRGRTLPSAGAGIHLQALPRFFRSDGSLVPTSNILFTWKRSGTLMQSISGIGKSSVTVDTSAFGDTDTYSVDAQSSDASFSASASVTVPSIQPVLALYEDHPLFGIMYHKAFGATTNVPDSSASFTAVPYFAPTDTAALSFNWTVNGRTVANNPAQPNEITINAGNSNGFASIALALSHATNFFLSANGNWSVQLSSSGADTSSNASNPFHGTSQ